MSQVPTHQLPDSDSKNYALQFISGNPTTDEIAAVTTVVLAAEAETQNTETMGAHRAQNRRARLGLRLRPGLGAWRRTLPFR